MPNVGEKICSACGYDLIAHPPRGKCPECGQMYDMASGTGLQATLSGAEMGDRLARRLWTIFFVGFGAFVLVCSGIGLGFGSKRWFFTGLVIAMVLFLGALASYVTEKER
jgi:hypothetical protein